MQFVSGISNAELVGYYRSATVVACPSLYEGFGLPAGEAMACGAPVVSSDGGALPEVVGDAGIVVPAGNSQALGEALGRVLSDISLQAELSAKGRARIEEKFSWGLAAASLVAYYREILGESAVQRRHEDEIVGADVSGAEAA
ncbi:glycosyltransferase [Microbulbifer sp. MLAF003]|uniref:glycosyltransferase n=1 Tax=Microbulbifer sp. MLAF003 TaxID=3032582 RepID=UPI0024AE23B2|nr:glycosyltransferase [Microbulbifer sp. MLAF003]WHI52643.1 glycosyltransferase [Microbulbifer sp. MLAF003]